MPNLNQVIAVSKRRERMTVDNGQMWKEYRVRDMYDQDWQDFIDAGKICCRSAFQPFVIEYRHIKTNGDQSEVGPWEPWYFGDTLEEAIDGVLGDTDFLEAISVSPLHAKLVEQNLRRRAINDEQYKAVQDVLDAEKRLQEFRRSCNSEFNRKSAGKSTEEMKKVEQRMLKKYGQTHEALKDELSKAIARKKVAQKKLEAEHGPGRQSA